MAWRFKASKYKNAAPIVPKPETCIRDIVVGSYQNYGNNITASAAFMAFIWEHTGSNLAVLPLDDCGRKGKTMPLLYAHSETITDLQFSPFHDGLLATSSQDCSVKVWHIPEKGLEASLSEPECTFSHKQRRVETVGFHPTADFLIHSTSAGNINLWDISVQKELFSNNEHPEVIQSLSWKLDGTLMATSCKDKMVRIVDPRIENSIVNTADSHASIKDSRVVWLGDSNRILTTGFDAGRLRQVMIRDVRNFESPEKCLELDCSTGILMPLFDPDTNMLFLAGKGDTTINYLEVTDKEPHLIEGLRHTGEQTKGVCLVPKRALKVMEGEVNRVLQLVSNSVIPIMYQVPRKSYRDFHSDLYPDTNCYTTELSANEWFKGTNQPLHKMSLDPAKRELGDKPIVVHRGNLEELVKNYENKTNEAKNAYLKMQNSNPDIIVKPLFVPIKDKIKKLEQINKTGENQEKIELEQKIKEIIYNDKKIANNDNSNNDDNTSNSFDAENESYELNSENIHAVNELNTKTQSNGNDAVPPKPLPRASRTNSVSDQGSDEINGNGLRPVAKPRTTTSGYKPRLGPKPFVKSNESGDFSFDNVFSVPAVPNAENTTQSLDNSNSNGDDAYEKETEVQLRQITNSKSEEEPDHEQKTDAIRTASEKIKSNDDEMFEERRSENSENFDSLDEKRNNFERFTGNRNSIAERRKLYERSQSVQEENTASPQLLRRQDSFKAKTKYDDENEKIKSDKTDSNNSQPNQIPKRTLTVFGRVSKFRHLKGTAGHKSTNIENIRNIGRQLPGECDGLHANHERVAIPLQGQGGKLAVFELSNAGRLADGVIPSLVNGSNIMDFQFDPFDPKTLAVACDDGIVKIWKITESGLTESLNTPYREFPAHSDKIYFIRFHPLASGVFLTASYDMTIKLWDIEKQTELICLTGHTDQIFSFSWSPCGKYGATVSKDGKIRIYDPRKSCQPIREGPGPVGSRGARIVWAISGNYIVVTGFDKVSERQISVFRATDLSAPLNTIGLDVSPAILIPFYDEDSSTLFVSGKGDSTIYAFEITDESPYVCPLSHHKCLTSHQGLSFLMKNQCDVSAVEFARALRLTGSTVEHLSFTVPRVKSELFQDDLFPPTRVLWTATMSASEWFAGSDKNPAFVSLQPEGMESLSSQSFAANVVQEKKKTNFSQNTMQYNKFNPDPDASASIKEQQEALANSVSKLVEVNMSLEQHNMEGVDENEWIE